MNDDGPDLIALNAYRFLEDAWNDGVAHWCRSASAVVLGGGRAWMVTASEGQAGWLRRRLLCEGASLFGIQFLDARSLRRELCLRLDVPPPALDAQTLEFLLKLHALRNTAAGFEFSSVARHPGACLAALGDLANADWLGDPGVAGEKLFAALAPWLPELRATGAWTPDVDCELCRRAGGRQQPPLAVCVFGWDASFWPAHTLLLAAARTAADAQFYLPLPRGTSETVQQAWLDSLAAALESEFAVCASSAFASSQADLAGRLEGTDMAGTHPGRPGAAGPELLVGVDGSDLAVLARDFVARWLADGSREAVSGADRLAILCPGRNAAAVGVVRALTAAGIALEDELGEIPEPSLVIQIQRAILDYHQENAGVETLLALIELLNEHTALWQDPAAGGLKGSFPLDPVSARRALHGAFADVQHHSARVLCEAVGFLRAEVARPLRELIAHLGEWPPELPWPEPLRRWERCLHGFGLTTESLEPLWSRLTDFHVGQPVPSAAFFQYLGRVLAGGAPAQRAGSAAHRFARVVLTTLEGAVGQTWDGVLFLDSNEGAWPIYPPENPFLDDAARARLNQQRGSRPRLLTSSDHAQLEHFRFLEVLENCAGPLAFGGVSRDPAELNRAQFPNEWALRCLVEGGQLSAQGETLLDRWHHATRRATQPTPRLAPRDAAHLAGVFAQRRDPTIPFDEYFFNFDDGGQDELPFTKQWTARDLECLWMRPATFALKEIFDVEPWRDGARELSRGEGWMIGRLVHRWLHTVLRGPHEPRQFTEADWQHALTPGLARARAETEARLRAAAAAGVQTMPGLPLWWQGVLHKADWAARRCLTMLAETARGPRWLLLDKVFRADLPTGGGRLRLQAHCDVLLLDRPELAGANCEIIDIRTGATPAAISATAAQVDSGRGMVEAALLLLAVEEGAQAAGTRVSVLHPDAALVTVMDAPAAPVLRPAFEQLAALQRSRRFGQRGPIVESAHDRGGAENLPLATTPVDPAILEAKGRVEKDRGVFM